MKRLNLKWLQRKKIPKLKPVPFTDEQIRAKAHGIWLSRNGNAESAEQDWQDAIAALEAERSPAKRFWNWTGFSEKKGWDFLQLLIVPAVLSIAALSFQQVAKENEQRLADDRARQEILSKYLDQMSELLMNKGLRKAKPDAEVFILAQARTATALRGLDTERQNLLIDFLRSSNLLVPEKSAGILQKIYLTKANLSDVNLDKANLSQANLYDAKLVGATLSQANLAYANLSGTNLSGSVLAGSDLKYSSLATANLSGSILSRGNFSHANLMWADLSHTHLTDANLANSILTYANLSNAKLSNTNLAGVSLKDARGLAQEQLDQAKLCKTTLPNGEISNRDCKALGIDPSKSE